MIKCERIVIVPFDMKYLQEYCSGFNAEITRYQWPDPFETLDDARNVLQGFLDEMEKGETLFFSVLSGNGDFLGSVEIHGLTGDCPEVGVWIKKTEQHKGYAYEVLRAVLDYAYSEYGRNEFFYEADVRNEPSNRLLRRLENEYRITDLETEEMITDSGKELRLQGHILTRI